MAGGERLMGAMYLTRARLRQDASVNALVPLLLGTGNGLSAHPGHHLVWSLFTGDPKDRIRDFLWREMTPGAFYILSRRQPEDRHNLFEIAPPKVFDPELEDGDLLAFSLRANPAVRRFDKSRGRSVKHDAVMDALHLVQPSERAAARMNAIQERGLAWLRIQGERAGFSVVGDVQVEGYQQHRVSRGTGRRAMSFSTLDFEGCLKVVRPGVFLAALEGGFGSAKAYGCGLMLVRPAR